MILSPSRLEANPELEKRWARWWPWHLFLFGAYLLIGCILYLGMRFRIGDDAYFFWEQRILSRKLLAVIGVHIVFMLSVHRKIWVYRWKRFFWEPLPPYALALMRILLCAFLFTHLVFFAPQHWLPLAGLPHAARQPLPMIGWLIDILPISPTLYGIALAAGIACGFLALIGLWTRPALLALIPLVFYLFGVPQFFGKMSHYQFFFWFTVLLAFSPCSRVWSMDALLGRIRGMRISKAPAIDNAIALRWLTLTLAGIYFFSGFRKLYEAGLFWALSDNPVNLLRTEWLEQFQAVPWVRVDQWPVLCSVAALGVIIFELAYPLLIFTARGRVAAALEAIAFHNLNGYFLKIDFVYLKTAHLSYFNVGGAVKWLSGRRRGMAWLTVLLGVGAFGYLTGVLFMLPVVLMLAGMDWMWRRVSLRKRAGWLLRLRKRLPPPRSAAKEQAKAAKWLRWSMASGAVLVTLNCTCGAFGIHSWPFSSYPSYSFVRSATMEYGWFLPVTADSTEMSLDETAKAAGFRKENILPMAERIVDAWKDHPENLESAIQQCWLRWRTELPALQAAVKATVVIRAFPVDPDHYNDAVRETYLGELELRNGEWVYLPDSVLQNGTAPK